VQQLGVDIENNFVARGYEVCETSISVLTFEKCSTSIIKYWLGAIRAEGADKSKHIMKSAKNETKSNGHVSSAAPTHNTVKLKTKFWAYFWWLFGGIFGAHHLYLGRDDQALIWFCTLGGYFGIGWLRDLFRIPTYVADANDDPNYINCFKHHVRTERRVISPLFLIPVAYMLA
jgi:TM2 domain-containing membrane protein YozV